MHDPFAGNDLDLGRAGWLLALEILGGIALQLVLTRLGFNDGAFLLFVWPLNLVTAWFLAKASRAQGRTWVFHGIAAALGPPLALWIFVSLHAGDTMNRRHGAAD